MTVPQSVNRTADSTDRTRLNRLPDIAFRHCGVRVQLVDIVQICDGLEVPFVFKQGQPADAVVRLSWTDRTFREEAGPFPRRFRGTEALTDDGLRSVLNYLSATSPEVA